MLNTSSPKLLILQNCYASHFALFWAHYKEWSYSTKFLNSFRFNISINGQEFGMNL